MKNIKKSNKILKSITIMFSLSLHMVFVLYPIQLIVKEQLKKKEDLTEKIQKKEFKVQLAKIDPSTKFVKSNKLDNEEKINGSNILSNVNHSSGQHKLESEDNEKGLFYNKITEFSDGEETDLSTVKFKYFDYYIKIKEEIENDWRQKINKHFKNIKLDKEITLRTTLILKVDQSGIIKNIIIGEGSGSSEFDKMAVQIFSRNRIERPPLDIFNNKEFIYLYWGFAIKI